MTLVIIIGENVSNCLVETWKKETTHIAIQPRPSIFSNNDDPFRYKQDNILMNSELIENSNHDSSKIAIPPQQGIAPRPVIM